MSPAKLSLFSVTPVLVLVALAAVLTVTLVPREDHLLWYSLTLAAAAVLTFCVQLGLDRKEGLVSRVTASLGGSLVLLAAATGVTALLIAAA